ncbi:hypothetical protein CP979_16290 [Streptomyces filamentosus]|nr:hypothetical protein CP979_16290 [Streptomyces filamentosus]
MVQVSTSSDHSCVHMPMHEQMHVHEAWRSRYATQRAIGAGRRPGVAENARKSGRAHERTGERPRDLPIRMDGRAGASVPGEVPEGGVSAPRGTPRDGRPPGRTCGG